MSKYTVICMKWGTQYGPEYVNILEAMIARNTTIDYDFVCFTDDTTGIHKHIETRPIPEIALGSAPIFSGWRKIASLSPELGIEGTVLFFDIDLVITDNIDDLFTHKPSEFCIIENWTQLGQGIGNSSVYRYEAGKHVDIFEDFCERHEQIYNDYINEQAYLTKMVAKNHAVEWWPEQWCRSFKRHSIPGRLMKFFIKPQLPQGCKVLVFHGPPKPMDAAHGKWQKGDGGKRGKFIHPSPWILDHWHDKKVS